MARVAGGESREEIAAEQGVSVRAVQRALKRAAAERPRENRQVYSALQIERLRRALRLADERIAKGDINGVYAAGNVGAAEVPGGGAGCGRRSPGRDVGGVLRRGF